MVTVQQVDIDAARLLAANGGGLIWAFARRYGCAMTFSAVSAFCRAIERVNTTLPETVTRFHHEAWNITDLAGFCPAGSDRISKMAAMAADCAADTDGVAWPTLL